MPSVADDRARGRRRPESLHGLANIPTFLERDAFNARESYALGAGGAVLTKFEYCDGSFEACGPDYFPFGWELQLTSTGFAEPATHPFGDFTDPSEPVDRGRTEHFL